MSGLMSRLLSHTTRALLNRLCTLSACWLAYFLIKAMQDRMMMPIYVGIIIFLALVTCGEQFDKRIKAGRFVDILAHRIRN